MYNTPILFIVFNRPELTVRVFERIKNQKPKTLFIAADGPRENNEEDIIKCKMTREGVLNLIDWNCEVKTLFRDTNLGCGKAVSKAIDWFFQHVEMGVILEDDCLPNRSFFYFCEYLLDHYKEDNRIFAISGVNFQNKRIGKNSYFFSKYLYVWGWATWKRAWKTYDFELSDLKKFKDENLIDKINRSENFKRYWYTIFDRVAAKQIDTWDYQWVFSSWKNNGLTVVPNKNLVSNIGFGEEATHTTFVGPLANMETEEITTIEHPENIIHSKIADNFISFEVYNISKDISSYEKIKKLLRKLTSKI